MRRLLPLILLVLGALPAAAGPDPLAVRTRLGAAWSARLDDSGSVRSLTGGAIPLLAPGEDPAMATARCVGWLAREGEALGLDAANLRPSDESVSERGRLISVRFDVLSSGVPVIGGSVTLILSRGNLIGLHAVGTEPLNADATAIPLVSADDALALALAAARLTEPETLSERLAFLRDDAASPAGSAVLTWELMLRSRAEPRRMLVRIDARSGAVISLTDETVSACTPPPPSGTLRRVLGGVKPETTSDAERAELLPQASVGASVAGIDGFFAPPTPSAPGRLDGPAISIECVDCANPASPLAPVNADGDADFGSGGVDAAGNGSATPSDRSAFFHASAARLFASRWLSIPFVTSALPIRTNINSACNAYWDGSALNFFRASARCSNTGESRDVIQHEWGHGLDENDGQPTPPLSVDGATGEAAADAVAMLRSRDACIGEGFFNNAADGPSPTCSGVRDLDELSPGHHFGNPATLSATNVATLCPPSAFYRGPLGREGHCEGEIFGQALWHLVQDLRTGRSYADGSALPDAALPDDDAWELVERLFFDSRPMMASYAPSTLQSIGMSAHEAFLLADDEGDGIANGTPHAAAIAEAFGHHGILEPTLSPADTPGCAGPGAPVVTVTAVTDPDAGLPALQVSWTNVGASSHHVLRSDDASDAWLPVGVAGGVAGPGAGSRVDRAVLPGRTYRYRVTAEDAAGCTSSAIAGVSGSPGAILRVAASRIDDTGAAIPDGLLEPGETVNVELDLENVGSVAATNVNVTLSSADPALIIVNGGPIAYGTIAAGVTVTASAAFRVRAASTAPLRVTIIASGEATEGCLRATTTLDIAAPALEKSGESIDDSIVGDADGTWEPGETIDLSVLLDNVGTRAADPVTGVISFRGGPVAGVTISNAAASWPLIAIGAAGVATSPPLFRLAADLTTGPRTRVPLQIDVSIGGAPHRVFNVDLQVGRLPAGTLEWTYQGVAGTYIQDVTEVIIPLNDDDGDGRITRCDPPAVMAIEYRATGSALLALDGATGIPDWELVDPCTSATSFNGMAAGDVDADGDNEIIVADAQGFICSISATGSVEWRTLAPAHVGSQFQSHAAPQIFDLDGDGQPEVIAGHTVLNGIDGSVKWEYARPNSGRVVVGDIDLDGGVEVLAGSGGSYRFDGSAYPYPLGNVDTFQGSAIVNLDADPEAEIVTTSGGVFVKVWNHDGTVLWQAPPPGGRSAPGPVAVGDFDGDGSPEIAVPNVDQLVLLNADGSLEWTRPIQDRTGSSGIAGFDFDADGAPELVYRDHEFLYIFDGATGDILWSTVCISGTAFEHPIIADVDADGHAEIIVNDGYVPSRVYIRCFGSPEWPAARVTWNQEDYSVNPVGDLGVIPRASVPRWLNGNDWRVQAPSCPCPGITPAVTWRSADCIAPRLCFALSASGASEPHVATWDFGDGSPSEIGDVPCHLFPSAGRYAVSVSVSDAAGCVADWSSMVEVPDPIALAFTPPPLCAGVDACFTAIASGGTAPISVEWDFGDGSARASGLLACHAFAPGTWTVTAFAVDALACLAETSSIVTVGALPADVGDMLFVNDHGSPQAASTDATLAWTGDLGAPRGAGESYVVLRSLDPRPATFARVPGTTGLLLPTWRDRTPQTPDAALPACHYYLIFAENTCGARSANFASSFESSSAQ